MSPEEAAVGSKLAQSGPLEKPEQIFAARHPQRDGLGRRHDLVTT